MLNLSCKACTKNLEWYLTLVGVVAESYVHFLPDPLGLQFVLLTLGFIVQGILKNKINIVIKVTLFEKISTEIWGLFITQLVCIWIIEQLWFQEISGLFRIQNICKSREIVDLTNSKCKFIKQNGARKILIRFKDSNFLDFT